MVRSIFLLKSASHFARVHGPPAGVRFGTRAVRRHARSRVTVTSRMRGCAVRVRHRVRRGDECRLIRLFITTPPRHTHCVLKFKRLRDSPRQGQDLERFLALHPLHGLRTRVRDPEVLEHVVFGEALVLVVWKHAVRTKRADFFFFLIADPARIT